MLTGIKTNGRLIRAHGTTQSLWAPVVFADYRDKNFAIG